MLGQNGSGLGNKADLVIGTFSKAFGSFGAYVACSPNLKDYLVNKCAGLIYTTALPPSVLGAIDAAIDIVPAMDKERQSLHDNASYFRETIRTIGFDNGASETQIVPIVIGDSAEALYVSNQLKEKNIWATAIREPTVTKGSARIRFAFSAAHEKNDIDYLLDTLSTFVKKKAA